MLQKKKIINEVKKPIVYAFIDSQNLNLGTSKDLYRGNKLIYKGWRLDFKKFRRYLSDKFHVKEAFLFIGFIPQNQNLYNKLNADGYKLIFKPTVKNNLGQSKGNVDAELVLHSAAVEYQIYDKAVIVSGDGDFHCLHKHLKEKGKLLKIIIPNKLSESSLLKEFQDYKVFIYREKENLVFKPK